MDLSRSIDQRLDDPAFMVDDYALSGFKMGVESHQHALSDPALKSFEKIEIGRGLHSCN